MSQRLATTAPVRTPTAPTREAAALPSRSPRSRVRASLRAHAPAVVFVVLAVGVRLGFWLYTERIWEDALITTLHARNLFEGNGLTHHPSEPRVHGFTSALSVLIPVVGYLFGSGLVALRLAALAAAAVTIVAAYASLRLLGVGRWPMVFVLGYLALDQEQILFGISGMETQVAVAVLLSSVYFLLRGHGIGIGVTCGLAVLARPDLILWVGLVGLYLLTRRRRLVLPAALASAALAVPWALFTWVYYSSPVPHTIAAKNLYQGVGLDYQPQPSELLNYLVSWWRSLSPFYSNVFITSAPVPYFALQLTVTAFVVLALAGLWVGRRRGAVLAVGGFLLLFFCYRTRSLLPTYFMWYLPPFTALCALLAGLGLQRLRSFLPRTGAAIAVLLVLAFAAPLPAMFVLERRVQRDIEDGVRRRVGEYLGSVVADDEAVVLEPVGYTGWYADGVTTWDYPGLVSEVAQRSLREREEREPGTSSLMSLIADLDPAWAVLRPNEVEALRQTHPEVATAYEEATVIRAPQPVDLRYGGVQYFSIDTEFVVLRRR